MFILVAVVAGLALGLLRGGSLSGLGETSLRLRSLLVLGIVAQAASAFVSRGAVALLLVSYALLLAFGMANLGHTGMGVVCIGIGLNFVVIAANDGMPVRAEAIEAAGIADRQDAESLDFGTKRHLETDDDRLTFLGDILPLRPASEVLSFGDLVLAVGVADVVFHRVHRQRLPPTNATDGTTPS